MIDQDSARARRSALSVCAASVLALATLSGAAEAQDRARLAGTDVAIYNLAGEVSVVRGDGSDVVVEIARGGADARQLRVEQGMVDDRQSLRIVYPTDRVVYTRMGSGSRTTQRVRDDGTFGHGEGGDRIEIRGSGDGLEAYADLTIRVPAGKDVAVYVAAGEIDASGVASDLYLDLATGRASATAIRGALRVDTGSGSVTARDVVGDVDIDTGSGEIEVSGLRGDGVRLDTGSGGVSGNAIDADALIVDTGSGDVDLIGVAAPDIRIDTGSGSVTVDVSTDVERLDVDTGSGGITVSLPESVGATLEIDTSSGGIDVDLPVEVSVARRDRFEGRVGDGRGRIRLDTGSGSIRLRSR